MKFAFVGAKYPVHERHCTHWTGVDAAFKRLPHDYKLFCCRYNEHYVDDIIAYKPDILIYNLLDMAKNQADRERLRGETSAKIVFWYGDMRVPGMTNDKYDLKGTVDLFIASNDGYKEFQTKRFGMTPVFVPLAAEPTTHPVFNERAANDFIFIGGKFPREGLENRMTIIEELELFHGLRVINGQDDTQRAKIYDLMPLYYGSANFTLDISHFWDIPKYTSNRFWVIPAVWGFPLTRRFPGHEELVPETHHVYWSTIGELEEKMRYYRERPEERTQLIQKGWEYAMEHHRYDNRIKRILELV